MIRVENLWKSYGDIPVLKGINLEVKEQETVVILGRSGVGKSVLLRQLIGIERPDAGAVYIRDKNITTMETDAIYDAIKEMGMLFQSAALFDSMNIFDNIALYLKEHGKKDGTAFTKDEIYQRVAESLKMVALSDAMYSMPSDLSGGMKKRAALARLMAYRPQIVLYDEPTTGLDPITAQHINDAIIAIQKELRSTNVIVTHDLHCAVSTGTKIALHVDGIIKHIDSPKEFFNKDDDTIKSLKRSLTVDDVNRGLS